MESKSLKIKRRKRWNKEAHDVLFNVWADNIGTLRVARRKSHILMKMANVLQQLGHVYTATEVKCKLHNLTNQYRDEKKKMLANKTTESDWDLFDRVHAILGDINIDDVKSDFTDNTFEDQYSESKSDGFEDYHIDISDDDDEKGYASTNEEETLQESVPSVEPKNGNAYLETINRNVEKVIQKLDIMHEQNLMAHRKKIKLEMERNDLLRDLLNTFKTNAPTSSSSIACGHNISKSSQTDPREYCTADETRKESLKYDIHPQDSDVNLNVNPPTTDPESVNISEFKSLGPDLSNDRRTLEMEILREQHNENMLTKRLEREFLAEKYELELENLRLNLENKKKDFVLQMLFK